MLTTIAVILIVLWLLGVIGVYSIGQFLHLFLAGAAILLLIRIIQGGREAKREYEHKAQR